MRTCYTCKGQCSISGLPFFEGTRAWVEGKQPKGSQRVPYLLSIVVWGLERGIWYLLAIHTGNLRVNP